jgi:hypothetical protein
MRRTSACVFLGLLVAASAAFGREAPQRRLARAQPGRGEPFAGSGYMAPYERVLDHSDLVLAGKLTAVQRAGVRQATPRSEAVVVPGRFELAVEKVLKGTYTGKTATVHFGGTGPRGIDAGRQAVLICLRTRDGKLILAGDLPEGGGLVREGPELIARLIKAAEDPPKGYLSEDFAVRLSAAYRLAMAYDAAPPGKKPKLPKDIIPTLIQGLHPDRTWRGVHVNAAARDALNVLLDCNITMMWTYSVYHGTGRRSRHAGNVERAWQRTVKEVRRRRAAPTRKRTVIGQKMYERNLRDARALLLRLGAKKPLDRQSAAIQLVGMPEVGLDILA